MGEERRPITCDEVERELAVPTGALEASALQRHLDECARCAREAEQLRRLDAAWQATRPEVPGSAAWASLWTHVSAEASPSRVVSRRWHGAPGALAISGSSRRQRWGTVWAVAAVAQAAAVLLGAYLLLGRSPSGSAPTPAMRPTVEVEPGAIAQVSPAPASSEVNRPQAGVGETGEAMVTQVEYELEEGQTLFLVLDERADRVVVKPRFVSTADLVAFDPESPDPIASSVQMDMELLNALEGME